MFSLHAHCFDIKRSFYVICIDMLLMHEKTIRQEGAQFYKA